MKEILTSSAQMILDDPNRTIYLLLAYSSDSPRFATTLPGQTSDLPIQRAWLASCP